MTGGDTASAGVPAGVACVDCANPKTTVCGCWCHSGVSDWTQVFPTPPPENLLPCGHGRAALVDAVGCAACLSNEIDRLDAKLNDTAERLIAMTKEKDSYKAERDRLRDVLRKLLMVSLPQDISGQRWVDEARAARPKDHDGKKCGYLGHLKAMCQRCHLLTDLKLHMAHAANNRAARKGQLLLFRIEAWQ